MSIPKARLRLLRSLRQKKYRRQHGLFLVEGIRLVRELLDSPLTIQELLVQPDRPAVAELLSGVQGVPIHQADEAMIRSLAGTIQPQGLVAVAEIPAFPVTSLLEKNRLLILDRVADPGNLGTLLRSALAFGVEGVLLSRGSVEVTSDKVIRASMGGAFHLPWATGPETLELCQQVDAAGLQLLAATPSGGLDPRKVTPAARWALLLGSEAEGLPPGLDCTTLTIPMGGPAESLNVAVAGALLLYELGS